MTLETAMLPIFLTAIALVTLWNTVGAKGHWSIKATVIVFVSSLCLWVWISLGAMIGWPIDKVPEGTYDVEWMKIVEPNKARDIKGGIYVWISNMDRMDHHDLFKQQEQHMSQRKPRAYGLPYSRELHEQVSEILKELKGGNKVRATIKPKEKGKGDPSAIEQDADIKFHKLPPSKPSKGFQIPRPNPRQQRPVLPKGPQA